MSQFPEWSKSNHPQLRLTVLHNLLHPGSYKNLNSNDKISVLIKNIENQIFKTLECHCETTCTDINLLLEIKNKIVNW